MQRVTKDMLAGEVVRKYPTAAFVMMEYGFHCVGCAVSEYETIEQGAQGHGMPPEVLDEMIEEINKFLDEEEANGAAEKELREKDATTQA